MNDFKIRNDNRLQQKRYHKYKYIPEDGAIQ